MSMKNVLPLLSLFLLGACSSTVGSGPATGEQASTVSQADEIGRDGDGDGDEGRSADVRRVLLLSVDGLHERDLENFIASHPGSALAELAGHGVRYTHAHTTTPSDSFPGMTAPVTGATPKTAGVYYDDSYDRTLYAPGSDCKGKPGTEVVYDESIEYDDSKLFSGGINPANLPLALDRKGGCHPVYPHEFIRVNTIFEVIRAAGGHTAWSDKHPAYDLLNGPSGAGIEDLYTPEINSLIANGGTANGVDLAATLALCDGTNSLPPSKVSDFTTCMPSVLAYDDTKVQAIVNEIDGLTSDGTAKARVPTIFGMNFQQVSVGEKLPIGGYVDAEGTPSVWLEKALEHTDASIGRMIHELRARGLYDSTLVIVTAKHGQSPMDRSRLHMESGGKGTADVQDPLGYVNAVDPNVDQVWSTFTNPNSGNQYAVDGHLQTDDVGIVWLQDQSPRNVAGVVASLQANANAIEANVLPPGTVFSGNITSGSELAAIFGDPTSGDPVAAARAPNAFIQPNWGVIYSGSSKKIAEHGGGSLDDTNVALLVSNPGLHHRTLSKHVTTTQIAPTILRALDLDPDALDGVRAEGTRALPGFGR
jgi:predicted AlkP superfamily pyrophosphatase or phosphodiesterase